MAPVIALGCRRPTRAGCRHGVERAVLTAWDRRGRGIGTPQPAGWRRSGLIAMTSSLSLREAVLTGRPLSSSAVVPAHVLAPWTRTPLSRPAQRHNACWDAAVQIGHQIQSGIIQIPGA